MLLIQIVLILCLLLSAFYYTRLQTVCSVRKLSNYNDYNIYRMDVKYSYDLDRMIGRGMKDGNSLYNAILKEILPFVPIHMEAPDYSNYGCSAFTLKTEDNKIMMGRNYDFKYNTSAMLVHCSPKNGYKSVSFAALDNIHANKPETFKTKLGALAAPFVVLDGVNEKGVSMCVLTLDSKATKQNSGKPAISTTFAIRLVLDRAATTEEAVELLKKYDMYAVAGRDYHFYITDAKGDGRAVEYDCDDPERKMVVTPIETVTNFYIMYKDRVDPINKNIYGHGLDRFEKIEKILADNKGKHTRDTAWEALMAAAQEPNPEVLTSNTQWSIAYNNSDLTAEIALRRRWNDKWLYSLTANEVNAVK